jgi:FtsH-binding integral membrane protein
MNDSENTDSPQTPVHLWIIGALALFWNGFGCFNYFMTQSRNEGYLKDFPQEQLEFVWNSPTWVTGGWALAVWSGLLGSIFLLLRKRVSAPTFAISLICAVIINAYNYGLGGAMDVMGSAVSLAMTGVIIVFAILLWMYARAMSNCGVLR